MLRFIHIICLLVLPIVWGCESTTEPSDTEVSAWASKNIEVAFSQSNPVKPEFFEAAIIPNDFDFPKNPSDFGEGEAAREIADANAKLLRDIGVVSALADHCGLQWSERNFAPMMKWQRSRLPESERNGYLIYKIGVSHGYAMGATDLILKHWQIDCDKFKADTEDRLFADVFP